jgi:2-dehydro-3-deoxyphosphogluconate aldolase/(4S)-4-hydroxy-2-oxoglutarate aldolase
VIKELVRARIEEIGIIPSVRLSSTDDAQFAAETVTQAWIPILEITMTVPGAVQLVADLRRGVPDLVVGAGTVLDVETARQSVDTGALFVTSPGRDLKIVEFALKRSILAMPGALTPTEITAASRASADLIKVSPCASLGGASYIRALKAPFPHALLVASGGVSQQTAAEFIVAGATALGIGTELIPKRAAQQRDRHWIAELTRRFLTIVQEARRGTLARDESVDRR